MGGLYKSKPKDLSELLHNYKLVKNKDQNTAITMLLMNLKENDAVKIDIRDKLRNGGNDNDIEILKTILLKEAAPYVKSTKNEQLAKIVVQYLKAIEFGQQEYPKKHAPPEKHEQPIQPSMTPKSTLSEQQAKANASSNVLPDTKKDSRKEMIDFLSLAQNSVTSFKDKVGNKNGGIKSVYKGAKKNILKMFEIEHNTKLDLATELNRNLNTLITDLKNFQKDPTQAQQRLKNILDNIEEKAQNKPEVLDLISKIRASANPVEKKKQKP